MSVRRGVRCNAGVNGNYTTADEKMCTSFDTFDIMRKRKQERKDGNVKVEKVKELS